MELNCKIVKLLPEQRGVGKNGEWVKNSFVVEWQENGYTQKLCLEVQGTDKWEKMKQSVVVGNAVLVKFNVTSREWQERWFTTASCFYCSLVGGVRSGGGAVSESTTSSSHSDVPAGGQAQPTEEEDLPF